MNTSYNYSTLGTLITPPPTNQAERIHAVSRDDLFFPQLQCLAKVCTLHGTQAILLNILGPTLLANDLCLLPRFLLVNLHLAKEEWKFHRRVMILSSMKPHRIRAFMLCFMTTSAILITWFDFEYLKKHWTTRAITLHHPIHTCLMHYPMHYYIALPYSLYSLARGHLIPWHTGVSFENLARQPK